MSIEDNARAILHWSNYHDQSRKNVLLGAETLTLKNNLRNYIKFQHSLITMQVLGTFAWLILLLHAIEFYSHKAAIFCRKYMFTTAIFSCFLSAFFQPTFIVNLDVDLLK
jgi:hypothetical protein